MSRQGSGPMLSTNTAGGTNAHTCHDNYDVIDFKFGFLLDFNVMRIFFCCNSDFTYRYEILNLLTENFGFYFS